MGSMTRMRGELRRMLRELFMARAAGTSHACLDRTHGYVDGYMHALLEYGCASKQQLSKIVAEERARIDGAPARLDCPPPLRT